MSKKQPPTNEFAEGQTFEVSYPFVREIYEGYDNDGPTKTLTWKPGVRFEADGDKSEAVADGEGAMVLTVVAVIKPGRFPTRVFFTRKFKPPGAAAFGKNKLLLATQEKFRRISRGYQYDYSIGRALALAASSLTAPSQSEIRDRAQKDGGTGK